MKIEYFDKIDFSNLDNYYSTEITIDSLQIEIDLNFETKSIDSAEIDKLNSTLKDLKSLIAKTWDWIKVDYKTGVDVKEYISFHLDDFFEDNPEEILQGTDTSLNNDERFLQTLKVRRIGFYPSSDNYIVLDYMTNEELSNYILVVNVNENIELENITVES